jgi:DNA modification methylase
MQSMPDEAVHLSIYSPPFAGLYQYSSDPADLSNCKNYEEFMDHFGFVVRELHRVTLPGRMTAVHCQDIPILRPNDHHLMDFPGDIVRLHAKLGWKYVARYHVWKEPLTVRNRTMVNSLHHKTLCEDSTRCSIANADYLLIFRRSGSNPVPVDHPVGLMSYAGSRTPPDDVMKWRGYKGDQTKNAYSQWVWRQYASAFWDDVRIDRTLGTGASLYSGNKADKDEPDEKHMHPLQLDVIERAVVMWSNPGETVLTPFMGVGSEVYGAVVNGRRGLGIELKPAYYRQAVKNLESATEGKVSSETLDMFSGLGDDDKPFERLPATDPTLDPDPTPEPLPGQRSFL